MPRSVSSAKREQDGTKPLNQRAEAILKARPAYREMVDFYLTVFSRQIEWRDRLTVDPEPVNDDLRRKCFRRGQAIVECYDPGLDEASLVALWTEMKSVFRQGNEVLRQAVEKIEATEESGDLVPGTWLRELRPDREELMTDAAGRINVDAQMLATLARAVTFPHWQLVARSWLGNTDYRREWDRSRCPTCGGAPGLAELRSERGTEEGLKPGAQRFMHCPFCATRWGVPGLRCPACGSTKKGDAKYLFTADEPELRIDFCQSCQRYVKVIDGDKISGPVHIGLELLTTAHLDVLAQEKNLSPLEVCA